MSLGDDRTDRVLLISLLIFTTLILFSMPCHGWHKTLTFVQQSTYELTSDHKTSMSLSDMKFFMWYRSYAIYGARETLILLQPNLKDAAVEIFAYDWSIDQGTMDECLQEWNTKDKCYNDVVHVRLAPDQSKMDVYCTYAHRPMVRSFDLRSMLFLDEHVLTRDPHPPMDSESSYVMLTFNTNIVTAGYQGDYIPTIRATHGRTLLYALRQNSYFIDGFKYDGKAVFGVIETSDSVESNRVSRLVMACANRTEIVRKAILNCSTDLFDPSRSFVFHILTALVEPIQTANGSTLLFATFTTNNSSITASAVCLFVLDRQFYDVFTAPSKQTSRRTSLANYDLNQLIINCSPTIPSTIDRDMVESQRQFRSYLSNPLLMETMATYTFTAINVIQYDTDLYCLLIGTSHGRLFTAFADGTYQTNAFEELTLPLPTRSPIRSIAYNKFANNSYAVIVTDHRGYLVIKLIPCENVLCFECWTNDCLIRKVTPPDSMVMRHQCAFDNHVRVVLGNDTDDDAKNQSTQSDPSMTGRTADEQPNNRLLFYIVAPMSFMVFVLSMSIVVLLTKSTHQRRRSHLYGTARQLLSASTPTDSRTYANDARYRIHPNELVTKIHTEAHLHPIQSVSYPITCKGTSHTLAPMILSGTSLRAPILATTTTSPQMLSVRRLYKSYV